MRRLGLLALLVASASAAPFDQSGIADWTKPPTPGAEPVFHAPVPKRMKLANGMALLVVENHALPIVALELVVPGAGAAADPTDKAGLAAFTADLLDEGAGGLSALAISEEADRLGAGIFLGSGSDAAYVSVHSLAKTLDPTLDLMTKIVTQPAFDPKEFARVRGDRLTALELRRDRPREVASIVLEGALYGRSSAYGHAPNGDRGELDKITVADAKQFYDEHWNPAAMTVVVAGDVDAAQIRKKLDATIGAWKVKTAKKQAKVVATPAKLAHRVMLVDRPGAAQSDVRLGIVGPPLADKRYFAFEVLVNTLGGGFTSRLEQRIREQLGITYGIGANMDWRPQPGPFVIGTAIQTPATAQGIQETLKIVDELAATDVPAAELDKSKHNLVRALPAMFETNAATASTFGELALLGLPDDFYAKYPAAIGKVTAADVKAAAKALIPSGKLVIAIVGDQSKIGDAIAKLALGDADRFDLYGAPTK